jgi:hypothetical protein
MKAVCSKTNVSPKKIFLALVKAATKRFKQKSFAGLKTIRQSFSVFSA